jgi:hypothetical protein
MLGRENAKDNAKDDNAKDNAIMLPATLKAGSRKEPASNAGDIGK